MVTARAQAEEGLYHHSVSARASAAYPKRQVQSPRIFTGTSERAGWPNDKWGPLSGEVPLPHSVQNRSGVGCCCFPGCATCLICSCRDQRLHHLPQFWLLGWKPLAACLQSMSALLTFNTSNNYCSKQGTHAAITVQKRSKLS